MVDSDTIEGILSPRSHRVVGSLTEAKGRAETLKYREEMIKVDDVSILLSFQRVFGFDFIALRNFANESVRDAGCRCVWTFTLNLNACDFRRRGVSSSQRQWLKHKPLLQMWNTFSRSSPPCPKPNIK